MGESPFDRVRPRVVVGQAVAGDGRPDAAARTGAGWAGRPPGAVDVEGRSALFSAEPLSPTLGSVVITCSGCHVASQASYVDALKYALPSVHLFVVRRGYPSWMRCPACDQRRWVRVRFH